MVQVIDYVFSPTVEGWQALAVLEESGVAYRIVLPDRDQAFRRSHDCSVRHVGALPAIRVLHGPARFTQFEDLEPICLYLAEHAAHLSIDRNRCHGGLLEWMLKVPGEQRKPCLDWIDCALSHGGTLEFASIEMWRQNLLAVSRIDEATCHQPYLTGSFSIVDLLVFPWVASVLAAHGMSVPCPHAKEWVHRIRSRPAVERSLASFRDAGRHCEIAAHDRDRVVLGLIAGHLGHVARHKHSDEVANESFHRAANQRLTG